MSDAPPAAGASHDGNSERAAFLRREAAEVYLLLDFLSGRADRSLRPTQEEQARALLDQHSRTNSACDEERANIEGDLCEPTRLVLRTMRIKYPIGTASESFGADATFLVRARDVLNTRAWPATGLTIAFTSMVSDGLRDRRRRGTESVSLFAERAYPQFRQSARWLALWVTCLLYALPVVLTLALAVSAYTAWGKVMLDTLDAVRRDDGATQQELDAAVRAGPAGTQPELACQEEHDLRLACRHAADISTRYKVTSL